MKVNKPFAKTAMSWFATAVLATTTILFVTKSASAQLKSAAPTAAQARYVPGEVLVKFKADATDAAIFSVVGSYGDEPLKVMKRRVVHVKLKNGQSVEEAIASYQGDPSVLRAQPNYLYNLHAVPNDALYGDLWALKNTGQTISSAPYPINNPGLVGMDIDAEAAWDHITDCSSVIVAVLDTGINYTHADLATNMWDGGASYPNHGWDFFDADNDPMPADGSPHGTHVAGIIGAVGNNASGTTGVCWTAKLMAVRVGGEISVSSAAASDGVDFAVENGAKVINMSFGGPPEQADADFYDVINDARTKDVLIVASAGNKSNNNDINSITPCTFDLDNIICVAALDQAYELADFSNTGATSVDLGAPGTNIHSAVAGDRLIEDFSTGWVLNGGWGIGSGDYCPSVSLVNPSNFCTVFTATYANNADDIAYKTFDLSDPAILAAGVHSELELGLNDANDSLSIALNGAGGNPFSISPIATILGPFIDVLPIGYDLAKSGCLTATCSIGTRLQSDAGGSHLGAHLFGFHIYRALVNATTSELFDGTSMSAPMVTGVAALVWAFNPNYTYLDVAESIKKGGDAIPSLAGTTSTGRALDAMGSLRYINPPTGISLSLQ